MAEVSLDHIRKSLKKGDAKGAQQMLLALKSSASEDVAVLLLKAEIHWELVQAQEAIGALKRAIQKSPRHAGAYTLLGKYLLNKGLPDQALNFFDRAITIDPAQAEAKRLRNRAERQKQKKYASLSSHAVVQLEGPGAKPQETVKRKEVTRQFLLNPSDLSAKAAEANLNTNDAALEEAFKLLLGAELVDAKSLEMAKKSKGLGSILSFTLALCLFLSLGMVMGVAVYYVSETISIQTAEQALFAELEKDNADSYKHVLSQAQLLLSQDTTKESEILSAQALSHYLLWRDHLDGLNHLERAAELIESLGDTGIRSPYGLLVRAYFKADQSADISSFETLDDHIHEAIQVQDPHPYVFLAAALVHTDTQRHMALLRKGIIARDISNPRLRYALAKAIYPKHKVHSQQLLQENLKHHPKHLATQMSMMAMNFLDRPQTLAPLAQHKPPLFRNLNQFLNLVNEKKSIKDFVGSKTQKPSAATIIFESNVQLFNLNHVAAKKNINTALKIFPEHPHLVGLLARTNLSAELPGLGQTILKGFPQFPTPQVLLYGPLGTLQIAPFQTGFPIRFSFDETLFPENLLSYMVRRDKAGEKGLYRRLHITEKQQAIHNALLFADLEKAKQRLHEMKKDHEDRPETYLAHFSLALAQKNKQEISQTLKDLLSALRGEPEAYLQIATLLVEHGHKKKALRILKIFEDEGFVSPKTDRLLTRMNTKLKKTKRKWKHPLNERQIAKQEILRAQGTDEKDVVAHQSQILEKHQALLNPSFMIKSPHYGWTGFFFQLEATPPLVQWARASAKLNGKWRNNAIYQLVLGHAFQASGEKEKARLAFQSAQSGAGFNLWIKNEAQKGLEDL